MCDDNSIYEYKLEDQKIRREEIFKLYLDEMSDALNDKAGWCRNSRAQGFREILWHCLALMTGGESEKELANNIIESLEIKPCHFSPMTSMQLLLKYKDSLRANVKSKLINYVKESLQSLESDRIHYTMYNDNFAGMAIFTLLTAGEMFADKGAFAAGMEKLEGLGEHFKRNGTITEYGSPTYTAVDTHPLAEIVNYVKNLEARELARKCEERMWAEIATHYHQPTAHLSGPYSRAYAVDMVGHPHAFNVISYLVFGDGVFINPANGLFTIREKQVVHIGMDTLIWPNIIWLASSDYHCPEYLIDIALNKSYPYSVICRSEGLPSLIEGKRKDPASGEEIIFEDTIEFPGYSGPNTSYMTEDFALGTAYSQYHDGGLTESFYLVYRKKKPAEDLKDTGVVFSKYIINEKKPEQEQYYNVYGRCGEEAFRDEGRKYGMQYRDCSMMVYKPKHFEAHNISSMKLSVLFTCHFDSIEEIYLGERKLTDLTGEAEEPLPVFVKDGPVYMAFKPLCITDHGRDYAVKVEYMDNYIIISFYNYQGSARAFNTRDILLTSNGFIAHIKSAADFANFSEFISYASRGQIIDKTSRQEGAYTRWVEYKRDDFNFNFAYSPISEGIIIDTINGHPRPAPVFQATGLNSNLLPFLGG